jgi:uncharacterized heparinase superfamily protein
MSMTSMKRSGLGTPVRADRLAWYYHRLRAMGPAEVAHRFGEATKRRLSRLRRSGWAAFDMGDGPLPALTLPDSALSDVAPALLDQWRKAARAVQLGHIELLGQNWPPARGRSRWHLDPATGRNWPERTYCFDIPYRHERRLGDVKYVWELNRLQFLQPVAALAACEHDEKLAALCLREIEDWIDANPPFRGINWASGIELALRVVSLLVVLGLIGTQRAGPALRRKIRACLAAHAYWLARYPSRHSSANNHLVAEAGALFLLGTLWPELRIAGAHAAEARAVLVDQIELQIHDDGVGAEQSPTYTAFTLEWYLLCMGAAQRAGQPLPKDVAKRLGRAGRFLRWITDEGNNCPRIGDDDEGRVIATEPGTDYVTSVLGCLAAAIGRKDLAPPLVRTGLRNLYFGVPSPCQSGPVGARIFSNGGYSVFRRQIAGRNTLMVMDHGPLGHLSIAAHGHADSLALWLHVDDQPVMVDAGTYMYHAGGPWRDRLRGTALHNTLCLDDQDSSRIAGPFNWSSKARCVLLKGNRLESDCVCARHDGYLRSHGLLHERSLVSHASGFTVRDALIDDKKAGCERASLPSVAISFLVHPNLDVVVEGATATISRAAAPLVRIAGEEGLGLSLLKGCSKSGRGWYSDRFGKLGPAPQLVFHPLDRLARQFDIELEIIAPSIPKGARRGPGDQLVPADTDPALTASSSGRQP